MLGERAALEVLVGLDARRDLLALTPRDRRLSVGLQRAQGARIVAEVDLRAYNKQFTADGNGTE